MRHHRPRKPVAWETQLQRNLNLQIIFHPNNLHTTESFCVIVFSVRRVPSYTGRGVPRVFALICRAMNLEKYLAWPTAPAWYQKAGSGWKSKRSGILDEMEYLRPQGLKAPFNSPSSSKPHKSSSWPAISWPKSSATRRRRFPMKPVAKTTTSALILSPLLHTKPSSDHETGREFDFILICTSLSRATISRHIWNQGDKPAQMLSSLKFQRPCNDRQNAQRSGRWCRRHGLAGNLLFPEHQSVLVPVQPGIVTRLYLRFGRVLRGSRSRVGQIFRWECSCCRLLCLVRAVDFKN